MSGEPRRAAVGIGSNLEPARHLPAALRSLAGRFAELRVSTLYRSAPIGGAGEPFVNGAVTFTTTLSPAELRAALKRLEGCAGRERAPGPPRVTLDLDLVILEGCTVRAEDFELPAPDVLTSAHLLAPLAEIWPDWTHPHAGRSLAELWRDFDRQGVQMVVEPLAWRA